MEAKERKLCCGGWATYALTRNPTLQRTLAASTTHFKAVLVQTESDTMDQTKAEAIQHIMGTLFSAQNALRSLAPEYKWAGTTTNIVEWGQ